MPTFDLQTHVTDKLTGKVTAANLYTLHVINGTQYWERPIGSKNLFFLSGDPAGRLTAPDAVDAKAEHVEFTPPLTGTEALAQELGAKDLELAAARKELAAIKAEREAAIKGAQAAAKTATKTAEAGKA